MDLGKQREKLAAWLAEWRLDQELPPPETTADATPPEAAENGPDRSADLTVAASGAELKAGDVVLLPPVGEVTSGRPVYVALLEEAPRGGWLCAPFSRFSTPATEGEFETDRGFDPLKVVCAWNANALSSPLLAQGWLVGHLAASDVKALADFASGKRAELPPARRGPPLVHPLDPRHEYLEEERSLWLDFRARAQADARDQGNHPAWSVDEPAALDSAAEKPEDTHD